MKTIGIIGGLTWHSTIDYYRILNETVQQRLGGVSSAKILIYSVNFAEIKSLTFQNDWDAIGQVISGIAKRLETAGADCILLGANTMHHIAPTVEQAIDIPLIHIADTAAKAIQEKRLSTVALLGTRYTMELDFYTDRLSSHGIDTILPGDDDRAFLNHAIYEEMGAGKFLPATKERILGIIEDLVRQGAEGVVLACTEIPILIKQADCNIPVFDTGYFHAVAAVDYALG